MLSMIIPRLVKNNLSSVIYLLVLVHVSYLIQCFLHVLDTSTKYVTEFEH